MDINAWKEKLPSWMRRYRYPILVILAGIVLMNFPNSKNDDQSQVQNVATVQAEIDVAEELEQVLTQIKGVGKVEVMLTIAAGERTIYQTDDTTTELNVRKETVIISTSDRAQYALVAQVLPPDYKGAIIVCEGADNAQVKLAVVDAVSKATGLGADRISVLKMK